MTARLATHELAERRRAEGSPARQVSLTRRSAVAPRRRRRELSPSRVQAGALSPHPPPTPVAGGRARYTRPQSMSRASRLRRASVRAKRAGLCGRVLPRAAAHRTARSANSGRPRVSDSSERGSSAGSASTGRLVAKLGLLRAPHRGDRAQATSPAQDNLRSYTDRPAFGDPVVGLASTRGLVHEWLGWYPERVAALAGRHLGPRRTVGPAAPMRPPRHRPGNEELS
jgi:hypothetical protein